MSIPIDIPRPVEVRRVPDGRWRVRRRDFSMAEPVYYWNWYDAIDHASFEADRIRRAQQFAADADHYRSEVRRGR